MGRRLILGASLVLVMGLTVGAVRAGVSYTDPVGGWTYLYTGDKCATQFDAALDGKWHHYDNSSGGSDAWDGSAPGQMGAAGAKPAPGGAGVFQDGDISFLRIQDPGDPRNTPGGGWSDPSNRKITFLHDITSETPGPTTILDDGITLSFRARIPTTPPLDPFFPPNGASSAWGTRGYNIHDDGYGMFGIKQGTSGRGVISFSLAMDSDEGDISGNGLTMNKKNGTAVSSGVDSYDSGGTENTLMGFDPTQWHEFWIQIVKDTSGGGTHKVTIWMDGDVANPRIFHVTAGSKNQAPTTWSGYLLMSLGRSDIGGAQDVDFFGYKAGLQAPIAARTPGLASSPRPADGATDVYSTAVLAWKPGEFASKHDLYLGTVLADVGQATRSDPRATLVSQAQDANTYDPTSNLQFGTTYYWRVDEVNAPPSSTIYKGKVWRFTTEPISLPIGSVTATASSSQPDMGPENTVNGSGLDPSDAHSTDGKQMWLSMGVLSNWIQFEFDKAYKLHELWVWNSNQILENVIGFGAKDVTVEYSTDGSTWTLLTGVPVFARASGSPGYVHDTVVSLGGVVAKYVKLTINSTWGGVPQAGLSEVRFFYVPVQAREPQPADGATDHQEANVSLCWRPGRGAISHKVYFSSDKQAVIDSTALAGTVTAASFDLAPLDFSTTYYWKIVEVNEVATPSSWEGSVWQFTTKPYAVVDDFEGYTNDSPKRVFQTWRDGVGFSADEFFPKDYDGNGTGAAVGHDIWSGGYTTLMETANVHGGKQAMPLYYDNTAAPSYSEAVRTFDEPRNWTASGIKSLSLYFRGMAGNSGQLYLKINNTKVAYNGGTGDIAKLGWLPWNIDLSTVGGSLTNVTTLTIGVEGAGAKGVVYIDDIRLYPKSPEYFTPVDPGTTNLLALYACEGNANDSSGHGLNGTIKQAVFVASGRPNGGSALQLDKVGYMDLGNPASLDFSTGDWAVTAWYKTAITGTGDANKGTIYGKGGDNTGGKRYALVMSESTEGVVTLVTDDDVTKYTVSCKSKTNDDQWHFVVGQRAGTTLQIYIDGQLEGSTTIPAAYNLSGTSQHNAYLGAITNHVDASLYKLFSGLLDEVHVYNRALSQEEVLWLAGNTAPVAKPF